MWMRMLSSNIQDRYRLSLVCEEKAVVTVEKYTRDVAEFADWLAGRPVTREAVLEYKANLVRRYAPASVNAALAIGALIGWVVQRWMKRNATEAGVKKGEHHGVLFASGMIVGESIVGVLIAMVVVFAVSTGGSADPLALVGPDFAPTADVLGFLAFAAVITVFVRCTMRSAKNA